MSEFFQNYAHLIVFIHVLGAFVWVGGMIAIRVAVHPVMQRIDDPTIRLGKSLEITGRLFALVAPFIALILLTGLVMAGAMEGHQGAHKSLFIAKELIWSVMTLNYLFMVFRWRRGRALFAAGDLPGAKASVGLIPVRLLPVNIFLGILALWMGVTLRGF